MKKIFLLLIIVAIGYSCEKEYLKPIYKQFDYNSIYIRVYSVDTIEMLRNFGTHIQYYHYVPINDTVAILTYTILGMIDVEFAHPTNTENNQMRLRFRDENTVNPFSSKILMLIDLKTISAQRGEKTITFKLNNDVPDLYFDIDSLPAGVVLPASVKP